MKNFLLRSFLLALSVQPVLAQDRIVKNDSARIEAKILEVGTEDIRYKKFSNPDGPVYTLKRSEIHYIIYPNGEKEIYTIYAPPPAPPVITNLSDLLPYVEQKLDVKFKNNASGRGVEVISAGPGNRIVGNWPGPVKWTITYAGPTEKKEDALKVRNTDDLLRVLLTLRSQNKNVCHFALQRNQSIPKIFHADISDLDFNKAIGQGYNGEKNSLVNLTFGLLGPGRILHGDSNCIAVIGRDMCRVNLYVKLLREKFKDKSTHIETWNDEADPKYKYDGTKDKSTNVNNNGNWLCEKKVKERCTIIDLGCDPGFYCEERKLKGEDPYYDCSSESEFYDRELLIAFGSYGCNDPSPSNITPTTVKPTDVKPTDVKPTEIRPTDVQPTNVNGKKNFKPFAKADGTLKAFDFYFGSGIAVKNSYAEGKPLHDFIDRFAAAAGQSGGTGGALGYFPVYTGFIMPVNKKRNSFLGVELQYVRTNKNAIIAFSTFGGYEIFLRAGMFNMCMPIGFGLDPLGKVSFVIEPGMIMGSMKGEFAFAPNYERYEESGALGLGFHAASGLNARFSRSSGLRLRAGQRFLKIQEVHKDPSSTTGYASFYVNGTDGETLVVDWSGFFATVCFDIYF